LSNSYIASDMVSTRLVCLVNHVLKIVLLDSFYSKKVHSFIQSLLSSVPTTFDLVTSFVSALNLHCNCPPSLLKALADSHPDWDIWLASFFEEIRGIQSLDMYKKITLGKYQALREKGAPQAIPTMCILTIKKDKQLHPFHAKSCIVVLGNHEDQVWSKSNKVAPVLYQDSL
jgi:hypothetical protein